MGVAFSKAAGGCLITAAPRAIFTIARVAAMLGKNNDWLSDVALEMDPEAGCQTVYGIGDEATIAFTGFGIENPKELIDIHKADPTIMKRYRGD